MNRREFLRTTASAIASALVPTWIPKQAHAINLAAFCRDINWPDRKYDMTKPFIQWGVVDDEIGRKPLQQKLGLPGCHSELFRYATDGRICIRVPSEQREIVQAKEDKLPPAGGLSWRHGWFKDGWKPWPKRQYIEAADSICPACERRGVVEPDAPQCWECQGCGCIMEHSPDGFSGYEVKCKACRGVGFIGTICTLCKGTGWGTFLGVQPIGSVFVDSFFDARMRAHLGDVEYLDHIDRLRENRPILFRFYGGLGMLMPLDGAVAKYRLAEAQ